MVLKALFPWLLIVLLSYTLSGFLYEKLKLGKIPSLITGFALGPVFAGQLLYMFYLLAPQAVNEFYLLLVTFVFFVLIYLFLPYRFSNNIGPLGVFKKLKNLGISEIFYLITIIFVVIFSFTRMALWPLFWSDQIDYFYQTHGYTNSRSSEHFTLDPLVNKKSVGIRPGLPLMTSYFVLFEHNNMIVEKQLQTIIFYYYVLSIFGLYYLVSRKNKSVRAGLFAAFLLVTCFYFTNFIIYGLKEIIIVSLVITIIAIFPNVSEIKVKGRNSYWLLVAVIFGAMSFIHFTGTVFILILGLALLLSMSGEFSKKLKFGLLVCLLTIVTSLGEVTYFSRWLPRELTPPSIAVMLNKNTEVPRSRLLVDLKEGKLGSYDINSTVDILLKGRLQGFTQIHYYGLVYLFSICLIVLVYKRIIEDKQGRFVSYFIAGFAFLIFNPLSLINHAAIRVLVSSPKYYLMLLPFLIMLAMYGYEKYRVFIEKLPNKFIIVVSFGVLVIAQVVKNASPYIFEKFSLFLVTAHRTKEYYLDKLGDLAQLYSYSSLIIFMVVLILILKKKNMWKEAVVSAYIFLLPFITILDSNFDISKTFKYSLDSRVRKISLSSEANSGLLGHISRVVDKHNEGELVLLYGERKKLLTDYYLLTKHDLFFNIYDLPKYTFDNNKGEPEKLDYSWIIKSNSTEIQQEFTRGFTEIDKNSQTTLYKRYE